MNNLNTILNNVMRAARDYPDVNLEDCYSEGQLQSKEWLVKELSPYVKANSVIYLMGGWYGTLAQQFFLDDYFKGKIRSFDIDPSVAEIAETFNRTWTMDSWRFKATTKDMFDIDLTNHTYDTLRRDKTVCTLTENPDIVINTSGEHIDLVKWWEQVPDGMLCAIQSNNYFDGEGHINCVNSISELKKQIPMSNYIFTGTLSLEKYDRYMAIGIK